MAGFVVLMRRESIDNGMVGDRDDLKFVVLRLLIRFRDLFAIII
jgi:hypothetical protein